MSCNVNLIVVLNINFKLLFFSNLPLLFPKMNWYFLNMQIEIIFSEIGIGFSENEVDKVYSGSEKKSITMDSS